MAKRSKRTRIEPTALGALANLQNDIAKLVDEVRNTAYAMGVADGRRDGFIDGYMTER